MAELYDHVQIVKQSPVVSEVIAREGLERASVLAPMDQVPVLK